MGMGEYIVHLSLEHLMKGENNMFVKIDRYNYSCNSGDTKRTQNVEQGAFCLEADTGDLYVFDVDDAAWTKLRSLKAEE